MLSSNRILPDELSGNKCDFLTLRLLKEEKK